MLPTSCDYVLESSDLYFESTMDVLFTGTDTYEHRKGNSPGLENCSANHVVIRQAFKA